MTIGNGVCLCESILFAKSYSDIYIDYDASLTECNVEIDNYGYLRIEQKCNNSFWEMNLGKYAHCLLGEETRVHGRNRYNKGKWIMEQNSELRIGSFGDIEDEGIIYIGKNAVFKIGTNFSIQRRYDITLNNFTNIVIGNDCMFSYEVIMRSNDGHTIFDIDTGKNINSLKYISRGRKIVIGNHVWIGTRVLILYGTGIGDGSIVGANSLVKKSIPNNCIAVGIPAKVIRKNIAWCRKEGAENIMDCGRENIHYTE